MSEIIAPYIGKWLCKTGQRLSIRRFPLIGFSANYYPAKGWPRLFLPCVIQEGALLIPLTGASLFGTTLELSLACEVTTREEVLIPQLQVGLESDWWEENLGVSWVLPLTAFRKK